MRWMLDKDDVRELKEWAHEKNFQPGTTVPMPAYIAYTCEGDVKIASGRARCRITGKLIPKGVLELVFYWDGEGNPWTAKEFHIDLREIIEEE